MARLGSAPRVLVAEDDDDMRTLVASALVQDGYEVFEARDGQSLLAHVLGMPHAPLVDLVVADIRMPFVSGLDVLEALRTARWNGPVILMTAFGDDEVRARAAALGAMLLDKPFPMTDLTEAVRTLIGGRQN